MSKIQEIVKKVASLPANTFALPSGSEGSACSSWMLKEINGYMAVGCCYIYQCMDRLE